MRAKAPPSWTIEKNCEVGITGICDIRELERQVWHLQPRSFFLIMRSGQDLTILERPPWLAGLPTLPIPGMNKRR